MNPLHAYSGRLVTLSDLSIGPGHLVHHICTVSELYTFVIARGPHILEGMPQCPRASQGTFMNGRDHCFGAYTARFPYGHTKPPCIQQNKASIHPLKYPEFYLLITVNFRYKHTGGPGPASVCLKRICAYSGRCSDVKEVLKARGVC